MAGGLSLLVKDMETLPVAAWRTAPTVMALACVLADGVPTCGTLTAFTPHMSEAWGTTPAGAVPMPPLNGLMVIWWAAMSGSYSLKILFAPLSHDTAMEFTPAGVGRPVPVSM